MVTLSWLWSLQKELHALWLETQQQTAQATKLDIERNKQKHLRNVDEALNLQVSVFTLYYVCIFILHSFIYVHSDTTFIGEHTIKF